MKKTFTLLITLVIIFAFSITAWGSAVGFGAKATAMGGAFTAVADDGSAVYWNPAGLTQLGFFTLTPGAGVYGSYDPNFDFNKLKDSTTFPPTLPNGNIGLPAFVGISTKFVGANILGDFGAFTVDNTSYTKLYVDGSLYGVVSGAIPFGKLAIGTNYKVIKGASIVGHISKIDPTKYLDYIANPEALGENYETIKEGDGYAIDIGVMYKLSDRLKLGFMGRNLYSSIVWKGTTTNYTIDPAQSIAQERVVFTGSESNYSATTSLSRTYTVGVAYRPIKSMLLAADVESITADDADLNITRYHFGFEQTVLWRAVALRLGASTNRPGEPASLAAGLGFKLGPVCLDLAANKIGDSAIGYFLAGGIKF
jgi:hypothetical protein